MYSFVSTSSTARRRRNNALFCLYFGTTPTFFISLMAPSFLLFSPMTASAYSMHHHLQQQQQQQQPHGRRRSRYFTGEALLPPLDRIDAEQSNDFDDCLEAIYTNDPAQVSQWLADHVPSAGCTLGFDLESCPEVPWRSSAFHGPAVVQLATPTSALVVHLTRPTSGRFSKACQPLLEAVLRDETIVKAGCGVDLDLLELRTVWPNLEARSRLDLGGLRADETDNTPGLKTLAASVLGLHLPKSRRITTSDWSRFPLTIAQVTYGARDAWVGAAVVEELAQRDPQVFGTAALVKRLESQTMVEELYRRQCRRKRAKMVLNALLTPYSSSGSKAQQQVLKRPPDALPTWKRQMVRKLRGVVKANKHGNVEVFAPVDSYSPGFCNSTVSG